MAEQRAGAGPGGAGGADPSMEDILASIRRILAEDQPNPGAPPAAAEPDPPAAEPEDVIDLTVDMLADDAPKPAPLAAEPPPPPPPPPAPARKPDPFDDLEVPMTEPSRPAPDSGLLGAQAASAAAAAFSRLSAEPPREPMAPGIPLLRAGGVSLEDIVRDELRPLLADWLNTNLPDIVERVVREEVRRVAGQR